ncbi:MAG: homoserine dehydrogenase [Pseudomonadales bacterium]
MKAVNVGICGLGTVGGGTFNVLKRNAKEISRRAGRDIVVSHVGMRQTKPGFDFEGCSISNDIFDVARDPEVDVVCELIGGYDIAFELVMTAIENGKHVVTANKALIAERGNEIFAAAKAKGVVVAYEAAVAGGIPIIKAVREGFSGNKINWLAGIINGTGNFILTEMRDKGRSFGDVLKEAQELGYAEADPTFDVEGIDACHKLTILSSIAFGIPLQFEKAYTEGISEITAQDVTYAEELGYRIKHLGISKRTDKGIELRVHPTLVPETRLLANVDGVMNAIVVHGDAVGPTLHYGAGAGAEPTASAVVADIVDVVRALDLSDIQRVPPLGFHTQQTDTPILPIDAIESAYYLRLQVEDRAGVMAEVATILGEQDISMEAILQKEPQQIGGEASIILLTRKVLESNMNSAINAIEALDSTRGKIMRIRVETLKD